MTVHLCHFISAYVNEQKFMFQIGTIIPMVSTNTFQSSKEVIKAIEEN